MDLSQLSDEELMGMATGKTPAPQAPSSFDMSKMSDDELRQMAIPAMAKPLPKVTASKGLSERALDGALWALERIDSVTGAPTRAGIDAALEGNNPITAFGSQFGEDAGKAPTGKTIAQKLGASETALSDVLPSLFSETGEGLALEKGGPLDFTASGAAGLGIDLGADWTNFVGAGAIKGAAKAGLKATKAAAKEGAGLAVSNIPKGMAKGLDAVTRSDVGTEALQGLSKFVSPKIAPDFQKYADIAAANDIPTALLPPSVEFGPSSFISRLDRQISEGPIGQMKLERFEQAKQALVDAVDRNVEKISGGGTLDEIAAGQKLRESFDKGVDNFFSQIDFTHNAVQKMVPGLPVSKSGLKLVDSKLNGIEKFAKGQAVRGITATDRTQADQLLKASEAVREAMKSGSYKQLNEARDMIGKVAFKAKNAMADIPPDIQKFRDLYFTIDEALIDTTRLRLGQKVADKLVDNNKMMSEFFGEKGALSPVLGSKTISNEGAFRSIVASGDSKKITALKKILPPEDVQKLKGAFLESLIRRNPDEGFSAKRLRAALQSKKNQVAALFEPDELKNIQALLDLGERMGDPILSTSGTGGSNSYRQLGSGIIDAIGGATVLDKMKAAARRNAPLAGQPPAALIPPPSIGQRAGRVVDEFKSGFNEPLSPLSDSKPILAARGIGAVAKPGSTMQANQRPDNDLVNMVDVNPEILETIKNPNLKRALQRQVEELRKSRGESATEDMIKTSVSPEANFIEGN